MNDSPMNERYFIGHQFYLNAAPGLPTLTMTHFCLEDARQDRTYYTPDPMTRIKELTAGETFYYQFDNDNNTAHCIIARYSNDSLIIQTEEIRTTRPDSDHLTEILAKIL